MPGKRPPTSGTRHGNGAGCGESQGDGWGGPASGAGTAPKFSAGNSGHVASRQSRAALRAERAAALEDRLYRLALHAEREETQVSAATRLHAIYEGTPVQRVITTHTDDVATLTDADLDAEIARRAGGTAAPAAGETPPGLPH